MKNIFKAVSFLILIGALLGGIWLVKRNQETRRGAAVAETSSSILPTTVAVDVGKTFVVNLWVNTGSTGDSLNSAELTVSYDGGKVEYQEAEATAGYSLVGEVTPESGPGTQKVLGIKIVSLGGEKSGAIAVAKMTFKMLGGSSQVVGGGKLLITNKTELWTIATNTPASVSATGTMATCTTDADCPTNFVCSPVPPGGCPNGSACAVPPRCWRKPAKSGEMCGGIAGIVCEAGLKCDYGANAGKPDASGTCVVDNTVKCGWCGAGCRDVLSNTDMMCPMIAPPAGKICTDEAGVCKIKDAPARCTKNEDCPTDYICSATPLGGCPTVPAGATGLHGSSQCGTVPQCIYKYATEGQMCGGIRGVMCAPGLECNYGANGGKADASGTCVKTVEKCGWCGSTCKKYSPAAGCPDSLPPIGQSCVEENGQCTVKSTTTPTPTPTLIPTLTPILESEALKFKTTFAGVSSGAACANGWKGQVVVMWGNAVKKVFDNVDLTKTDEIVNGLVVFKGEVSMAQVGAKNNLAIFVKGPRQLMTKYGKDSQGEFYNKPGGEVNWTSGKVFDFTKYANLAGDVTGPSGTPDGVVDGIDFAYVKGEVSKRSEGDGMKADLNGNCKLESLDLTLLMLAMKDKQEQMY